MSGLSKLKRIYQTYLRTYQGGTPFVVACELGHVNNVNLMIRQLVRVRSREFNDVGTDSNGYSRTPLMAAAEYERSTIIEILLHYNADTATTNLDGFNALHCAAWKNKKNTTTVRLLLDNMKLEDINHKNIDGDTPLDLCFKNNSSIQQQLIDMIRQKGGKRAREPINNLRRLKKKPRFKKQPRFKWNELTKELEWNETDSGDPCNVEKLNKYKAPTLNEAEARSYTFIDKDEEFTIEYCPTTKQAKVTEIKIKGNKSLQIREIIGEHTLTKLKIDYVYMENAKGKGFCTRAVAYLLKVLLDEAAKINEFPYEGTVYIATKNPCAAVNCYSHAFMINGFLPNKDEMKNFMKKSDEWKKNTEKFGKDSRYGSLTFIFSKFISKSQEEKFRQQISKKRKKVENTSNKNLKL